MKRNDLLKYGLTVLTASTALIGAGGTAQAADAKKPNIVIIWGDDIGQSDISAYSMGLMGFKTPNIDRVAKEGVIFTDYYAEQSCTAGRASFITGQCGLRTGNTKVGLPGAAQGPRHDLSADARGARLPARERLQELHRLRRRHRVHAPVGGTGLWHPAVKRHRQQHEDEV